MRFFSSAGLALGVGHETLGLGLGIFDLTFGLCYAGVALVGGVEIRSQSAHHEADGPDNECDWIHACSSSMAMFMRGSGDRLGTTEPAIRGKSRMPPQLVRGYVDDEREITKTSAGKPADEGCSNSNSIVRSFQETVK